MRKLLISVTCFFCVIASTFAKDCPQALPTNDTAFCTSFEQAAACQCENRGLSSSTCSHTSTIYWAMLARYARLNTACKKQNDTAVQTCIDDWNCYINGGVNSQGLACSGTGRKC